MVGYMVHPTSSSARVNMCFSITTLSHRELVSRIACGSSSSQSASLLPTYKHHPHPHNIPTTHLFNFCVFLIIFFLSFPPPFAGASFCVLYEKSAAATLIFPAGPACPNLKSVSSSI